MHDEAEQGAGRREGDGLISLIYVSSASRRLSQADLLDILSVARRRNEAAGVTGMLLHKDGNFMQVLEGPARAVKGVYGRIVLDPRHKGAILLLERAIEEREFGEWSMGFCDVDGETAGRDADGRNDFLSRPLTAESFRSSPAGAAKLLLTFRKSMR